MPEAQRRVLVTGGSGFIGSHLLPLVHEWGGDVLNVDLSPPRPGLTAGEWVECDIRDRQALTRVLEDFDPTHVLHLAARTDTDSDELAAYTSNTLGTTAVVECCRELPLLERFVFVSTQFVIRPGGEILDALHFDPHTAYGESKMLGELLIRAALPESAWVIVRPTNVWGPYHPRYGQEFLKVLASGRYLHPGGGDTIRTYGYVENVAYQMLQAARLPRELVSGRVFYLGEPPIELRQWTEAFSRELRGSDVRVVPRSVLRGIAIIGDGLKVVGLRFPLTTSRYHSMTEDYITPIDLTEAVLGRGPVSFDAGVRRTSQWFRTL
jgi:nucleoside-diphosphate-sugar epimerase